MLILDEPTVGLDPKQIIEIRSLIKNLGKHHTVILSSHILQEIEAVCDRIVIINKGVLVADDTASNLAEKYSNDRRLMVRISGSEKMCLMSLAAFRASVRLCPRGKGAGSFEFAIEPQEDTDVRREISTRVAARNWVDYGYAVYGNDS